MFRGLEGDFVKEAREEGLEEVMSVGGSFL